MCMQDERNSAAASPITSSPKSTTEAGEVNAKPMRVGVVVVTFNRKKLLQETLECIRSQTYPIFRVIVVDNLSTDGTREFLRESCDGLINPLLMERNMGGAGGFSTGIEHAYRLGS